MIKHSLSAIAIMMITATSFGQTTKQKFNDLKNNSKTIENAAKADAGLINKKNIVDSGLIKDSSVKRKEPACRSKRKIKSAR